MTATFFGSFCPYSYAGEIWRYWSEGGPEEIGEWAKYPPDAHASWLHVIQTAWFDSGRLATRYSEGSKYVINGRGMANVASFYCALGEAINGPGGYFGSNLDALADCLRNSVPGGSFQLLWQDFSQSEQNLEQDDLASIISVLQEFGIEIILSR